MARPCATLWEYEKLELLQQASCMSCRDAPFLSKFTVLAIDYRDTRIMYILYAYILRTKIQNRQIAI